MEEEEGGGEEELKGKVRQWRAMARTQGRKKNHQASLEKWHVANFRGLRLQAEILPLDIVEENRLLKDGQLQDEDNGIL